VSPARAGTTRVALTSAGRVALLLALGASTAGAFEPGLARPLAALAWSSLLLAAVLAWRHTRGLVLAAPRPARAPLGARLELELDLRAPTRRHGPLVLALAQDEREAPLPAGLVQAPLGPEPTRVRVAWRVRRRGRVTGLVARASSSHPLGLVRVTRAFALECDLLGLPRRGTWLGERTRVGARNLVLRGRAARGDEELVTVRDWRAGESLRRMHWRLSARRGRAIVRELATPAEGDLELVLESELDEPTQRARRAAFERAVSLTATLAEQHLRAGRRLALVLGGESRARGLRGRNGLARALALLAEVEPCGPPSAALAPAAAPARGSERVVVRAGGGRVPLPDAHGARVLDVDTRPGHPHHAPWRVTPAQAGAGR